MPNAKKAPKKDAKPSKAAKPAAKPAPKKEAPIAKPRPAAPKPTYSPPPPPKPAAPTPPPQRSEARTDPQTRPTPKPAPAPVQSPSPEYVKKASFADRKAALEALAEKEGLAAPPPAAPAIKPQPTFVREAPAADRKAALERVVDEQGVTGLLSKAPWKRPAPPPAPAPQAPAERTAPKVQMTRSPIEQTTGRSAPQKVILDSNALMMQFQFHIDIEKEVNRLLSGNYHYVVPQIVVDELTRLSKSAAGKEAAEARMAVELAKTFQVVPSPGDGDTGILRLAEEINAIVVTNDRRLRAQLRAKEIPSIYMRNRAFLTLEGHVPGM